jgi:hypothetical protein
MAIADRSSKRHFVPAFRESHQAGAVAVTAVTLLTTGPEHLRQMLCEELALSFEIFRILSAQIWRFDA